MTEGVVDCSGAISVVLVFDGFDELGTPGNGTSGVTDRKFGVAHALGGRIGHAERLSCPEGLLVRLDGAVVERVAVFDVQVERGGHGYELGVRFTQLKNRVADAQLGVMDYAAGLLGAEELFATQGLPKTSMASSVPRGYHVDPAGGLGAESDSGGGRAHRVLHHGNIVALVNYLLDNGCRVPRKHGGCHESSPQTVPSRCR